ncbi:E3 ubiquitin-protein ligase RNF125 isoform X2 [Delphinapterus leucas]|uniref:E3 ubiquitin-protein ligase RNF125 n=1 Tax=Delphinapterus leucas TaxID=9749 RepID=A0A2Y9PBI7_DELLE|nr:E3 ubiquitin-protein ligase RNF125 isoform X2 [Delphinapterus leucas]
MGSVLSSDSGKSAPASATPRALERRGDPELPVTSFDCSVCLEVLHHPVRTRCGHVFCRSCIATSLKNNKWTCPYCRAYLPSEGVPATDVAKKMKSEFQKCTECDTLVCLSEMRAHIRTCQKYIDKYGPLQELGETATRCVCPFCQKELDEDSLLDHCITHHRSERRPVSTGSRCAGSAAMAHGPSFSVARGIFPDRGMNPHPLHRQADSQPLRHQGRPKKRFLRTYWCNIQYSLLSPI